MIFKVRGEKGRKVIRFAQRDIRSDTKVLEDSREAVFFYAFRKNSITGKTEGIFEFESKLS